MAPEYYFRIAILMMARETLVTAFSILDFASHIDRQIAINSLAQLGSYIATKSVGNDLKPSNILPVVSNLKTGYDFIQLGSDLVQQRERAATLALLYSTAGAITKVGDIPSNASMGALLAAFGEYMLSTMNTGNTPFIYHRANRLAPKFTFKQQVKLTAFFIFVGGFLYFYIFLLKNSLKYMFKRIKKRKIVKF